MRSTARDVDGYLAHVSHERLACVSNLRSACQELLVGFQESMAYGMPSYSRDGVVEVAFASRKQYVSLYVLRTDVLESHRGELKGFDVGKGCIRYRRPDQIDEYVVRSMLVATAGSHGPVC